MVSAGAGPRGDARTAEGPGLTRAPALRFGLPYAAMAPPRLIDDRWLLGPMIGAGGSGRVWEAVDRVTGKTVAFKMVSAGSERHRARVRREIQALRSLQIAGVVQLLDVGEYLDEPYIVMEFVVGSPFPGRGVQPTWPGLAQRTFALLQVLAQVHAAGIVHRDLKPDNILVGDDGRVTLLDFGLARELLSGATVTATDAGPVGTPRYLSPEQILGHRADARADLYAVGVMLFEALTGRPPLPDGDFWARVVQRLAPPAPRIAVLLPDIDPALAAVVDQLLAVNPQDRPPTAQAALAALHDLDRPESLTRPVQVPLLGRERELAELLACGRAGESRNLAGPPGSGRSRLLHEVVHRLRQEGREVVWLAPATEPFASVRPAFGAPTEEDGVAEISARMRRRLEAGLVLVIGSMPELDFFSRLLVEDACSAGAVLRIHDTPDALRLGPLPVEALRPLFHGPDRILHLREDAAAELHERSGGLPGRVGAELRAWLTARLCVWDEGRIRIGRADLDKLRGGLLVGPPIGWSFAEPAPLEELSAELLTWIVLGGGVLDRESLARAAQKPLWEVNPLAQDLERRGFVRRRADGRLDAMIAPERLQKLTEDELLDHHRAIAAALPVASEARLRHWMIVGDSEQIVEEALGVALAQGKDGRSAAAAATLAAAWLAAQPGRRPETVVEYPQVWACLAIDSADPAAVEAALRLITPCAGVASQHAAALLRAYADSLSGRSREAAVEALAMGPQTNADMEVHRLAVLVRDANERGEPIDRLLTAIHAESPAAVRERRESWLGMQAYQRGDFPLAAERHAAAASLATSSRRRAVCWINEASARLDSDEPEAARQLARQVLETVGVLRLSHLEAWAYGILRCASYRSGERLELDEEWIAVSRQLGPLQRHAHACLIEAAAAWRRGDHGATQRWAGEAADGYLSLSREDLWVLPEALRRLVGGTANPDEHARLTRAIQEARAPRYATQAAELLARADSDPSQLASGKPTLWGARTTTPPGRRWDVLTVPEELVLSRPTLDKP